VGNLHRARGRPGYKIKRIVVKPKASLSLQSHRRRSEHWVVISGDASMVNGEQELVIHPNQSTFIPAGNKHRLANPGTTDLVIIEARPAATWARTTSSGSTMFTDANS
jgi:mannose-1-phosphate guanylyltransferase/mannose-6-phosphate isomerase